jgi:hypothetical protein
VQIVIYESSQGLWDEKVFWFLPQIADGRIGDRGSVRVGCVFAVRVGARYRADKHAAAAACNDAAADDHAASDDAATAHPGLPSHSAHGATDKHAGHQPD